MGHIRSILAGWPLKRPKDLPAMGRIASWPLDALGIDYVADPRSGYGACCRRILFRQMRFARGAVSKIHHGALDDDQP